MIAHRTDIKTWTVQEIADFVGVSVGTPLLWISEGYLNAKRASIGNRFIVLDPDLQMFFASRGGLEAMRQKVARRKRRVPNTEWRKRGALHDADFIGAFCEVMRGVEGVGVTS